MKRILLFILIAVIIAVTAYLILTKVTIGKIDTTEIEIAEVEIGSVMRTIPAEGTVEPESEVLILSPASSIITRIVKDVGSRVELGEAILILDPTPIQEEIERIKDQLEVKRNSLRKNQLNARSIRVDLDYNLEVKKLRIASLKSELADQEQLLEVGGISPANLEKTKQELVLAEKDLETLNTRNSIRLQQLETEEEGLLLQISIQEKDLEYQQELLNKMIIRAPSSGIILSLDGQQGEKVNKDKLLVKMSNLSNFKILANADAEHSDHIKTGNQVFIQLPEEELTGQIGNISPAIRNKKIEFDVYLNESNHPRLRPNMTLPLKVVIARADSVLRVRYNPELQRSRDLEMYRVEGNVAVKQHITTGLQGDNFIEIRAGAAPGDRLIVSDDSQFRSMDHVELN